MSDLIENYLGWLRSELRVRTLRNGGWEQITTPFLNRINDYTHVYVRRIDDKIELSDDGYIVSELRSQGIDINSPSRKKHVTLTLGGFGITLDESEHLKAHATESDFGERFNSLLQSMLALNDMYMVTPEKVAAHFREDVQSFLDSTSLGYEQHFKITGTSGYRHDVDFRFGSKENQRFLLLLRSPAQSSVKNALFTVTDGFGVRPDVRMGKVFAMINDERGKVGPAMTALQQYGVEPILWSQREKAPELLR